MAEDIYKANSFRALTEDNKAYRIGDTVTVSIYERTSAETSATTESERGFALSAKAFDNTRENDLGVGIGKNSEGDAATRRNGFVIGTITAQVIGVSESGLLTIAGQQQILLNGEKSEIKIQGQIRRDDINANNVILSNRITNATIEFIGDGVVSEAQKKGWIATIFDWLGII